MPEASKMARFYFVSPANSVQPWKSLSSSASPSSSDGGDSPKGIVLLLPSTGEQGSEGRLQLAERLAEENGFCSLVLTAPLYGARKPAEQQMHYARTVALYLLQSSTIIEEAALLLCWCADRWPGVPLCVSGFSWGGAMTCVSAILASQWARGAEVLAVPYAGSATPAVIVARDDVDWPSPQRWHEPFERRVPPLKLLLQTHLSEIVKPICDGNAKGRPQLAGLRAVSFENDYFVVRAYGEELFDIASSCCARRGKDARVEGQRSRLRLPETDACAKGGHPGGIPSAARRIRRVAGIHHNGEWHNNGGELSNQYIRFIPADGESRGSDAIPYM